MTFLRRSILFAMVATHTLLGLPLTAQASLVTTQEVAVVSAEPVDSPRGRVIAFLDREDVRAGLLAQGVSSATAAERVQAMTDAEVAELATRVAQAPAGGDVLGLVFTVFIVLLVTDILGLTKVFPFTRSVR